MAQGSKPGRIQVHDIFREVSGPTIYSKRHIITGLVKTAFSLIMEHIRTCTETEASRVFGTKFDLSSMKTTLGKKVLRHL